MTVLLVLFTMILFLGLDHFVQKRRVAASQPAYQEAAPGQRLRGALAGFPGGVSLTTNHTWMKNNPDGTTTIGLDELLGRLVGAVESVSLPRTGFTPAAAGIGFRNGSRVLQLTSPVAGEVVETNPEVAKDPSLLVRDPYGKGWLMRIAPRPDAAARAREYVVDRPLEWLQEQVALVRDFLALNSAREAAPVLQEGGLPSEGALQQFDENVWKEFGRTFTSLHKWDDVAAGESRS